MWFPDDQPGDMPVGDGPMAKLKYVKRLCEVRSCDKGFKFVIEVSKAGMNPSGRVTE